MSYDFPKVPAPAGSSSLHRRMKSNEDTLRSATLQPGPQRSRREGEVCSPDWGSDGSSTTAAPGYNATSSHAQLTQSQPVSSQMFRAGRVSRTRSPLPTVPTEWPPEGFSPDEGELVAECFICLEGFDEDCPRLVPRNLRCGHAFCTGCLEKLLATSGTYSYVDCPICHFVTKTSSVSDLSKNYPLMSVMRTLDPTRKISQGPQPQLSMPKCPEHDDYLRSYCLKDGTLICSSCELYGSHRGHPTQFLNEAADAQRKQLAELNVDVTKRKVKMNVALTGVEQTCRGVQEKGGAMEDQVDSFFQRLSDLVEEKKKKVKNDIRLRTQLRVNPLLGQAKDLRDCIAVAEAVNSKARTLLHRDDYTLLREVMLTLEQIKGVFTNPPPTAPSARNDLKCGFVSEVEEEIASNLERCAKVTPDVVTIDSAKISVESFYDGFRISWEEQNFADNQAISYHLQMARGGEESYVMLYRGSSTKYTWKSELDAGVTYRFRLQVRTTEGVGNWSECKEAKRAEPSMRWHSKWRSLKVELSEGNLEATWLGSASGSHWATFAADTFFKKHTQNYVEIEILNLGKSKSKKKLAIGVIGCADSNIEWQNRKLPIGEWEGLSWAFFPVARVLRSHSILGDGDPYGQQLEVESGDRIGILLDSVERKIMYFCNGSDLGVAFDDLEGQSFLLAVSIRDKIKVRLRFPPPPYGKRSIKVIQLKSKGP